MSIRFLPRGQQPCYEEGGAPELAWAGRLRMEPEHMSRPLHTHLRETVFWLVLSGRVRVMASARRMLAEQGDLLIVQAGTVVDLTADSPAEFLNVGITGLRLDGLEPDRVIDAQTDCLLPAGQHSAELEMLLRMILQQARDFPVHAGALCAAALSTLVLRVRQLAEGRPAPQPQVHHLVGHIQEYLDEHYAESITLGLLAERFYVSPYYTSHIFKEITGYSPIQYINRRRVGEAQTLLMVTEDSITKIADKVGFDSPNYFSTAFNKMVGVSPQRYRQIMLGDDVPYKKQ